MMNFGKCRLTALLAGLMVMALSASAAQVTFHHDAPAARAVYLAGSFNGWDPQATAMSDADGDGVWTVAVELPGGEHQYKFVVDGSWVHDPVNLETTDDGFGGKNSVLSVPAAAKELSVGLGAAVPVGVEALPAAVSTSGQIPVTFQYAPGGSPVAVYLAGEFNGWNASGDQMADADGDGSYTVTLNLPPGDYQYKFVVDGQWHQDPDNPEGTDDGFGGQNSVVHVKAGLKQMKASEGGSAPGSDRPGAAGDASGMRTVEFAYTPVISGVSDVFLAGTFNDWNAAQTRMSDPDADGTYTVALLLPAGTYQYKFVVDGQWHQDPNNTEGADDGFGGQNSVLRVDASFAAVQIARGDGDIYTADLEPIFDYSTCNPLTQKEIEITARAHRDDVQEVSLLYQVNGQALFEKVLEAAEQDPAFQFYRGRVQLPNASDKLQYLLRYRDGGRTVYLGPGGVSEEMPAERFTYSAAEHPPFLTPDWAKDGVIYQIFPERFRNGDERNDPDFSEPWYAGATELPAGGKTDGEYFHLVKDWYDVAGLVRSPYRTDGKPDYYSFYGGDIEGIREKLDYLTDLGVTIIYFNPLNQGMSNHKYDPVDYLKIDPHFATEKEFRDFVQEAHAAGIRIVVDMAFNHTGNWHFAFRDAVQKGDKSQYWNWYEFHRWPLPQSRDFKAADYYDCWWGFGLHPNLNYDLKRPNADENNIADMADAAVNQPLVDYVLSVAEYWLGELDIDGFRLDVPNEVPFWFWRIWNEQVHKVKPDAYLVGELWGNAGRWIGPHCFDATMNYKFFRDPVMDFFGKSAIDAATFDQRLAPGRFQYPPQAVAVMMNLIDSHDTVRFLTTTQDVRRLMLAALFSMTYVGIPTIWYGDEIGMEGGRDPDCRRPFDWRYEGDPRKKDLRNYYGRITRFRRDNRVLSRGAFTPLVTDGSVYAFARTAEGRVALVLFNSGVAPRQITLPAAQVRALLNEDARARFEVVVGPDSFPRSGESNLTTGAVLDLSGDDLQISLPPLSGALLAN